MIKTLAFIVRRPDITRAAFRNHYETWHVPFALPLLPMLHKYVRNHVVDGEPGFDCLTEFWYPDRAALEGVMTTLRGKAGEPIRADELRFMDKLNNAFCAGDETLVLGPDREAAVGPSEKFVVLARAREGGSVDALRNTLASELRGTSDLLRLTAHVPWSLGPDAPPWDAAVELWLAPAAKPPRPSIAPLGAETLLVVPVEESETALPRP